MAHRFCSAGNANSSSAWHRIQIPGDLGVGYSDRLALEPGLAIIYSHYCPNVDLREPSGTQRDDRILAIAVSLEGRSCFEARQGQRIEFLAGRTVVGAYRNAQGERRYLAGETVRQVRLVADRAALGKYGFEHVLGENAASANTLRTVPSQPGIARLAATLARLHSQGGNRLNIQVAALTLLGEQCQQLSPAASRAMQASHPADRQRIRHAREIIETSYGQALTIAGLCAATGLNEFKLKQGFQDAFGTSPYRLLTEIRMRKAWELLASGERPSSVAYQVGFQHPSSFSAAFQRHYQRTPKSVGGHAGHTTS